MNTTTNLPEEVHDWYIQPNLKDFSFNPFFLHWNFEFFILISKDFRSKHSFFTTSLVPGKENSRSWMNTVFVGTEFLRQLFSPLSKFLRKHKQTNQLQKPTNNKCVQLHIYTKIHYTFIKYKWYTCIFFRTLLFIEDF